MPLLANTRSLKGISIYKDLGIPVSIVCDVVKKFAQYGAVKNFSGCGKSREALGG